MGRVKYIIVREKDLFIENLIRQLIKEDINYVSIDNEIHFLDNIVRVLDSVEDRYLIMDKFLEDNPILVGNDYIRELLNKKENDYFDIYDERLLVPEKEEKVYQKSNFKFNNRRNNKMINNRLKGNRNINLDRR